MFTITLTIEADDLVSLTELLPQVIELAPNDIRIGGCCHEASAVAATPQPDQASVRTHHQVTDNTDRISFRVAREGDLLVAVNVQGVALALHGEHPVLMDKPHQLDDHDWRVRVMMPDLIEATFDLDEHRVHVYRIYPA